LRHKYSPVFYIALYAACSAAAQPLCAEENEVRYIKSVEFEITGRTKKSALERAAGIKAGTEFSSVEDIERYIDAKRQELLNNRGFAGVTLEYIEAEAEEDGRIPVSLTVRTEDTRNFVILPYPKYNSGGVEFSLRLRDYNFSGAMAPLEMDFGGFYDEASEDFELVFKLAGACPFRAFGLNWNLNFALGAAYVLSDSDVPYSINNPETDVSKDEKNTFGLSVEIPLKRERLGVITIGAGAAFIINEERDFFYKYEHQNIFEDTKYFSEDVFAQWKVRCFTVSGADFFYIPVFRARFYEHLAGDVISYREGIVLEFSHRITFEKINWSGNFREGLTVSLQNTFDYNTKYNKWNPVIAFTLASYDKYFSRMGLSAKMRYRQWFSTDDDFTEYFSDKERIQAGNVLRGVADRLIYADDIWSFNFDFPVHIFDFMPSEWFKTGKLKYINFELFVSPFADIAYVDGKLLDAKTGRTEEYLHFLTGGKLNGIFITSGFETIFFPVTWRSVFLRLSIGWDITRSVKEDRVLGIKDTEIYLGLSLQY